MSTDERWWRQAVVYQIYLRSFADGNGDGTGDISGLRQRLGYLSELGVDAIWLNPWYRSPLADGGYDVSDFRDIAPEYGTLADAEALIADAHDHDLRVIVDLVPNHTSSEHEWFVAALAAPKGSPERARYHFVDGKGPDGSEPPSDWNSVFGGPAWTQVDDGQWYLHLFDSSQPDLNWDNPEVVAEYLDIFRFWLDRGADGFRVDVAHGLAKDTTWPDLGGENQRILAGAKSVGHPFWDRDEVHEWIRGWRRVVDSYDGARMMVAEAWVPSAERMARYLRPDEYHQSFNFGFLETPWDATQLRSVIEESVANTSIVGSTPTWVLSNHDVVRHATRYGLPNDCDVRDWLLNGDRDDLDETVGLRRARAGTLLMLALPGGSYLYQGEELGLGEVHDLDPEVLDDPVWERSGHTAKGRDGCRVPIPWTSQGPGFGFTSGQPWLPMPDWFADFSVEAEADEPDSTLSMYRAALSVRARLTTTEDLEWVASPDDVLYFTRGDGIGCIVNMGSTPFSFTGRVLVASAELSDQVLPPDTAVWVET